MAAPGRGGHARRVSWWPTPTRASCGFEPRRGAPPCRSPGWRSGGSASLAGRPHDHLVDAHVRRPRDGVDDRVRDVLRLEHLADLLARARHRPDDNRVRVVALEL